MSINVFWAYIEESEKVSKIFYAKYKFDQNDPKLLINYCPAFKNKKLILKEIEENLV